MRQTDSRLSAWDAFIGEWQTEGTIISAAGRPTEAFVAADRYEWLPGRHFLVHHWDAQMPDGRVQGLEVIGQQPDGSEAFFMHSYDSFGNLGLMTAVFDGDAWRFTGETLRFQGSFAEGGEEFSGTWESRDPGSSWSPLMRVTLRRQTPA